MLGRGLKRHRPARAGRPDAYYQTITLAFLSLIAERTAACPFKNFDDFARVLADPELSVVDMVPTTGLGATTVLGPISIAGISGALAGA